MPHILYRTADKSSLDIVAPLWLKLREHHRERSLRFQKQFDLFTWDDRRQGLLEKTVGGSLLIDLAYDGEILIGYCISTVTIEKRGEIESIYIEEEYRTSGIGTRFMQDALSWMDRLGADRREIGVAAGNEEALPFYARFGFYPRVMVLEQVPDKEKTEN